MATTSTSMTDCADVFVVVVWSVAGIDKYPKKLTKSMSQKKVTKRAAVKPFVKSINFLHMMPTRYQLDIHDKIKQLVNDDTLSHDEKRRVALKNVKRAFDERYLNLAKAPKDDKAAKAALGAHYFFTKLHF